MKDEFLNEIKRLRDLNREYELRAMLAGDSVGCQYSSGYDDALSNVRLFILSYFRGDEENGFKRCDY